VKKLSVTGLVKSFKKRKVVDGVSLTVEPGEIVGLLGPNGAGKTTTFYMIVGLVTPDEGAVTLGGRDITATPMFERARYGISYLPQEASVFRKLTVAENVKSILEYMDIPKAEMETRLRTLLEELGVLHLADSRAYALSGGERRRVEIARALVNSPSFLLLDEPFSGIDPIAVADIQDIMLELKKKGIGVRRHPRHLRQGLHNRLREAPEGRHADGDTRLQAGEGSLSRRKVPALTGFKVHSLRCRRRIWSLFETCSSWLKEPLRARRHAPISNKDIQQIPGGALFGRWLTNLSRN